MDVRVLVPSKQLDRNFYSHLLLRGTVGGGGVVSPRRIVGLSGWRVAHGLGRVTRRGWSAIAGVRAGRGRLAVRHRLCSSWVMAVRRGRCGRQLSVNRK